MSSCALARPVRTRLARYSCKRRAAATVVAALAMCIAGCQEQWPQWRSRSSRTIQPREAPEQAEWPTTQPVTQTPSQQDLVQEKVEQYIASLQSDSLANRIERYEGLTGHDELGLPDSPTDPTPAGPPVPGEPDGEAASSQPPPTSPPTPQEDEPAQQPEATLTPPTVVAVEPRPAAGAFNGLDEPVQPPAGSNRPVLAIEPSNDLDLKQIIQALRSQLAEQPNQPDKQFALRMLSLLDGQYDLARATIDGTNAELQEVLQALVDTLIAAQPDTEHGLAANADGTLQAIEKLRRLLATQAELRVPMVAFCRSVASFGVYDRIGALHFRAGAEHVVILYCEIANYSSRNTDDGQFETLLTLGTQIYTVGGQLVQAQPEQHVRDLCRNVRKDFFIAQPLRLPATLSPGPHVLKVAVTDMLAAKRAETRLTFHIFDDETPAPTSAPADD